MDKRKYIISNVIFKNNIAVLLLINNIQVITSTNNITNI